jgi:hypothetical protein
MDDGGEAIPLSRFRARLARGRAGHRIDALLSASDPAAEVCALSIPEIYFLIAEVGLADAYELVALATPEQIQGCFDLEVWDRDRVQNEAVMPWLAALMSAGFEKLGQVWEHLDPELAALILRRGARIHDLSLGEEIPEESELPIFETPDRFFAVELTGEREEDVALIYRLIDDLYRADMQLARHTLMAARSEIESELEEMSYRWRSGRLADLGYADFYDALEVFRPLDPASVTIGEGTAGGSRGGAEPERGPGNLPVPMLERVIGRAFLARAISEIVDEDKVARIEAALIVLVNMVLAAARVRPGDERGVEVGTDHATATLALGLEVVSGGDPAEAARALETVSLTRLHRVGYTVTLRLARLARQLAPRAATAGESDAAILEAVLAPRPFFPMALEDRVGEIRPFESRRDVAQVADRLRRLTARIAIAGALGVDLIAVGDAPEPRPELDDYARTALAQFAGGGELDAAALTTADLERFIEAGKAGDERLEAAVAAVSDRLGAENIAIDRDVVADLIRDWFRELADELGDLDPTVVDPRFVAKVILAASRD